MASHIPVAVQTHKQKVLSLYKKALRNLESWHGWRLEYRFEAVKMRQRFEEHRNVSDEKKKAELVAAFEKELFLTQHWQPKKCKFRSRWHFPGRGIKQEKTDNPTFQGPKRGQENYSTFRWRGRVKSEGWAKANGGTKLGVQDCQNYKKLQANNRTFGHARLSGDAILFQPPRLDHYLASALNSCTIVDFPPGIRCLEPGASNFYFNLLWNGLPNHDSVHANKATSVSSEFSQYSVANAHIDCVYLTDDRYTFTVANTLGGNTYGRESWVPDWVLDYWHPLEKAQYPEYFARREKRKEEFIKNWIKEYGPLENKHH